MKVTPRKYALALLAALERAQDSEEQHTVVRSFLSFLWRKKQFRLLPKILTSFEEAWNRENGVLKLYVSYPEKFERTVEDLRGVLKKQFRKEPAITAVPDAGLIGGYRVRFADYLIDASVSGQLKRLKQEILST